MSEASDALQRLIDKDAIRDVMARYARGVDRADWDLVRTTYHPDAYDDHGDYKGGIDGFVTFGKSRTGGATQVMHFLGQSLIEFASADVAIVETYFMTAHTLGPEAQRQYGTKGGDSGGVQLSQFGRYADRFERRAGEWRVAHRIVIFESTRVVLGTMPPLKPDWATFRRDPSDPIFKLKKEAGRAPSLADVIGPAPDSFRLTAMVTAFNEADVIRPTVQYLLDQGIDVVVIDNWSTDSTMDEIADLVDGARVSVLKFPEDGPSGLYEWERMLEFVATAAAKVDSDWIVHHDADQRHEAPWPGASYRDAIYAVDRLGFNAIDHTVIDFRPVNDDFVDGTELRDHFHYFEFDRGAAASTHVQAWRNDGPVDLASSGGHAVKFADRKVFPFNFLLRHYQIRSQAHGERKVFRDRRPRYQIDELDRGWHEHYLSMSKRHSFIRKASDLNEFRPEDFGEHYLLQMVAQVGIIEAEPAHRRFGPLRDAALNVLRSTGTLRAAVRARNRILAGRR
mgnify:CR=1 FL=1